MQLSLQDLHDNKLLKITDEKLMWYANFVDIEIFIMQKLSPKYIM